MFPKLPQRKKLKEASFTDKKLDEWLREIQPMSMAIESKQTEGDSIPFSEVSDEQLNYLLRIRSQEGVKIRTLSINGQPDHIWLRNFPSFIFIKFPNFFCGISPDVFIQEMKKSKRKSLTSERAKAISSILVSF